MLRRYDDTEIQFSLYIHTWPYRTANGSHKRYRSKLCYCYCLRIFELRWGKLLQWRVITSTEINANTNTNPRNTLTNTISRWGKLLQWRVITSTKITYLTLVQMCMMSLWYLTSTYNFIIHHQAHPRRLALIWCWCRCVWRLPGIFCHHHLQMN